MITPRLDSIYIKSERDWSQIFIGFHRIFPLNAERAWGRNQAKSASIWVNWSPIFVEIGLVVRFDRLSGGNLSFN